MQDYNEKILNILNKLRTKYVLNNNKNNSEKSFEVDVYERLVNIFGEEVMLNLNSFNISDFEKKLSSEYLYSLEKLYQDLYEAFNQETNLETDSLFKDDEFMKFAFSSKSDLLYSLSIIEDNKKKVENNNLSIKRQDKEKENFKKLIEKSGFISKKNIGIMMNNLNISLTNGVEINDKFKFSGGYNNAEKKICIRSGLDIPHIVTHEMLHAASAVFDEKGNIQRVGVRTFQGRKSMGMALNEGLTEYYNQQLFKGKTYKDTYADLVAVSKDLIQLYGDENVFDAYLNDPRKLEVLMEKDGKNYMKFSEMFDAYFKDILKRVLTQESIATRYEKIGQFIEEIKEKRQMENPEIYFSESEWKKVHSKMKSVKENHDILDEKQVLLDSGESKIDFRNSLKPENFKTEFDILTNEEENIKREKQSSIDLGNER